MSIYERYHNYDLHPVMPIRCGEGAFAGREAIAGELSRHAAGTRKVVVVECYPGVKVEEMDKLFAGLNPVLVLRAEEYAKPPQELDAFFAPLLTEDRVFGKMNLLELSDCYEEKRLEEARAAIEGCKDGLVLVLGTGASLISQGDLLLYADVTRWEIQLRYRQGMSNWHTENPDAPQLAKYKRGFFIEWRMADRLKGKLFPAVDYWLDTVKEPVMISGKAMECALGQLSTQPFRMKPYFDPGVWGGHWMKDAFHLPENGSNYAWCFDGVPEENSLMLGFGDATFEMPAMNLVLARPKALLGERNYARFGAEYPIRFDFLDTMGGGNLSLQVHPTTDYIQKQFGMHYTQDESYYILDAADTDAYVYLGLKEDVDPGEMGEALRRAQTGREAFDAERFVNKFPVKKHDHVLIPAGTVHCSGANTMVLEISATPYIFTFKLWDWSRVGLDGLPRPVHIDHGLKNIQWDRTTAWVQRELLHREEVLRQEEGILVEHTGLHELEFVEVQRYTFDRPVLIETKGGVHQLNLVEGAEIAVRSPDGAFAEMVIHYAETFIVPAAAGAFELRPVGKAMGEQMMVLDAFVR